MFKLKLFLLFLLCLLSTYIPLLCLLRLLKTCFLALCLLRFKPELLRLTCFELWLLSARQLPAGLAKHTTTAALLTICTWCKTTRTF